jgi:hypothetical protein
MSWTESCSSHCTFPHEHVVEEDVVVLLAQLVLNPHQLELALHFLRLIEDSEPVKNIYEGSLAALQLGSKQIPNSKHHQVDVCKLFQISCF